LPTGEVSAEERYRPRVCYEDITQSRHAGKRTGENYLICCFYLVLLCAFAFEYCRNTVSLTLTVGSSESVIGPIICS